MEYTSNPEGRNLEKEIDKIKADIGAMKDNVSAIQASLDMIARYIMESPKVLAPPGDVIAHSTTPMTSNPVGAKSVTGASASQVGKDGSEQYTGNPDYSGRKDKAIGITIKTPTASQVQQPQYPGQDDYVNFDSGVNDNDQFTFADAVAQEPQAIRSEKEKLKNELQLELQQSLKDQMKIIQGEDQYDYFDVSDFGFTAKVVIPKDFKMPEFEKYDGNGNPILHLKAYYLKMTVWSREEEFLMALFPESLCGPAFQWYMELDPSKKKSWKDVTRLFINQYKYNLDIAPTREQLSAMRKKPDESFKQYVQRWMSLAVQVRPPLHEHEQCSYILSTLESPFVEHMIGVMYKNVAEIINGGERIERSAKAGRLGGASEGHIGTQKKLVQPKKEVSEVHSIHPPNPNPSINNSSTYPSYSPHNQAPFPSPFPQNYFVPPFYQNAFLPPNPSNTYPQFPGNQSPNPQPVIPLSSKPTTRDNSKTNMACHAISIPKRADLKFQNNHNAQTRPPRDDRPFPDFNMPKLQVMEMLLKNGLITLRQVKPFEPPYPNWYNPDASCAFHMGIKGRSIENCDAFRKVVWDLLDKGIIELREAGEPNVQTNPLSKHGGERK